MKINMKNLTIIAVMLVCGYTYFYVRNNSVIPLQDISTFEECAAAGYPVMESYPERCSVPGGGTYTRVTTDESPTPITPLVPIPAYPR
jgi:hypothetical protein